MAAAVFRATKASAGPGAGGIAMIVATVVDWSAVLKTVVRPPSVAGDFGIALVFSVAIFGAARFADLNRGGEAWQRSRVRRARPGGWRQSQRQSQSG